MREEMYKAWGEDMLVTSNYGMSELMGPGVSGECEFLCGMHINEDYFIPEIINPVTGEVLPAGEKGELVITCIKKEGLPLIRYRTKDITRLIYEPCKCGRTFVRMENLSGRSDDMLKIRGVNVFPSQIEEVIFEGFTNPDEPMILRVKTDNGEGIVDLSEEQLYLLNGNPYIFPSFSFSSLKLGNISS